MNVVRTLWLCGTGLLLIGCVSSAWADPLPIRLVGKGGFSGIQEPKQEVIKDKAAWEKFWIQHAASGKAREKSIPTVDFSKEMVIVVTMGRKNTGGYQIEITKVEPVDDKLRISVARKTPPPGAMSIQTLTAPFYFVAVPKSSLAPQFVEAKPAE